MKASCKVFPATSVRFDAVRRPNELPLHLLKTSVLALCILLIPFSFDPARVMAKGLLRYQNPIPSEPVRDPQITKVGSEWYMTATSAPFFEKYGQSPGVKIWRSKDLMHWAFVTLAVTPSPQHWYKQRFWAPELFPYKGKWYLTFNCPLTTIKGPQSVGLAMADRITGPYRVLTVDKPLAQGNDATLFEDDNGKVYLFVAGLAGIEVDLERATTLGSRFAVFSAGHNGEWDGTAEGGPKVSVEGPSVFKHDGIYYLLYAWWGRGYEEGYATARQVKGPWTKFAGNPIYGAQDEPWAKLYKHAYTQNPAVPYRQVGHGSPFIGPDGRMWFGCHGYLKGEGQLPHLIITPVTFDATGTMHLTLTWTPQQVAVGKPFHLELGDTRLASPVLSELAIPGKTHLWLRGKKSW
jgi:xylan 1,4-beta-xylosidase